VNAVARGRGVKSDAVRNGFGEGGMEHANDALKLGMIDRIATLEETIRRVGGAASRPSGSGYGAKALATHVEADQEFRRRRQRLRELSP
jgi:ClpP class serine protease